MHTIQFQAWGHDTVVLCLTCDAGAEGLPAPTLLLRSDPRTNTGISLVEAVAAIEAHTGEGAFRATVASSAEYGVRNRKGLVRPAESLEDAHFIRRVWAGRPKDEYLLEIVVHEVGEWRVVEEG